MQVSLKKQHLRYYLRDEQELSYESGNDGKGPFKKERTEYLMIL